MTLRWQIAPTAGAPAAVRVCDEIVAVSFDDSPSADWLSAFPTVADRFAIAAYAESERAAILARTLEQISGSVDFGFSATLRKVRSRTRTATVRGSDLKIANGRTEHCFFGGPARLHDDFREWEEDEEAGLPPIAFDRLVELEEAGVDIVELPSSPAVDNRFAGLNLAQPVILCLHRLRQAQDAGRLEIICSP